eukprot:scaffold4243_cov126-Cylindrotheca_fusiformis.AAC.3
MSGEYSDGGARTAESSSAGCSLSERLRPKIRKAPDLEGLAVFTWGRGEDGQLGLGDTSDQDEPTYVDALRGVGVRQIACGSGHTVVLSTEGEVFTWGRGDDGRLGHGDNGWKYVPRITQSLAGQVVTQVTCGSYHTAAVSGNGDLFTWGGGMYGKLGHGNEAGHSTPKRVEALTGLVVSQIACGSRHTTAVVSSGALYSWGDKEVSKGWPLCSFSYCGPSVDLTLSVSIPLLPLVAGHGDTEGHQYTPKLVERLAGKKIVQLSACGFHTCCLDDTGDVYSWGEGKFGRLGHGTERNCHTPRLIESLLGRKPKQVSCGGFHTAVCTEDGHLYTFGGGEHGQLGHNDRVNKLKPTIVEALESVFVTQITCGWSHSVALTSQGQVYCWGNGDHGKLGHGSGRKVSVPNLVDKLKNYHVVRVASYNEHTAALVEPFDHTNGLGGGVNAVPVTTTYTSQMRALVNDDEFSDVTFMVQDQPIYAHRAILVQRCEHFAAMFRSGMRESCQRTVPIPDISRRAFLLLLEYIYTDTVKVDVANAIELYIASDIYQLERLRDMCCTVVRRNLNAENAGPLLQSASENHCEILREVCMAYVVENFDVVSKTEGIKQVSHSLLLEILSQR